MDKFSKVTENRINESTDNKVSINHNDLERKVRSLIDTHLKVTTYGGYDDLALTELVGQNNLTSHLLDLFSDKDVQKALNEIAKD
jgi:hypothetical protein